MSLISNLTLFLSFITLSLLVSGSPLPENILLAKKYAPQLRFHKNELYFPSSVEYFLSGPVTMHDGNGPVAGAPSPLTPENLANVANQGSDMYITTDVGSSLDGFLRGQNPNNAQPTTYAFIVPKDNGVVDLYYWVFSPYNLAKKVPVIGYIGNHVGDWERIAIRTVNGVATQIDYHAHGDAGSGTIPYSQALKFAPSLPNESPKSNNPDANARPVAYVAEGSHGFWSSAGTFTYVDAVVLKLQDETSDGGVYWDTQNSLTTINYPETYTGSLSWLNFRGRWGNKGVTNCWWHFMYKGCELVDAPNGPLRPNVVAGPALKTSSAQPDLQTKMSGPLSQTLATVSTEESKYTIRLPTALRWPALAVTQKCATLNTTATHDDEDPQYSYTYTSASLPSTPGTKEYTFSVPACDSPSTVASYAVGYCNESLGGASFVDDALGGCTFSPERLVRAFSDEPGVMGIQQTGSVIVDDLDNWYL